jgi:hypothetical protein
MRSELIEGSENTMAGITGVDLALAAGGNPVRASPDLLQAVVQTFAEARHPPVTGPRTAPQKHSHWPGWSMAGCVPVE